MIPSYRRVRIANNTFRGLLIVRVPEERHQIDGYLHVVPSVSYRHAVGIERLNIADALEDANRAFADYVAINQLPEKR